MGGRRTVGRAESVCDRYTGTVHCIQGTRSYFYLCYSGEYSQRDSWSTLVLRPRVLDYTLSGKYNQGSDKVGSRPRVKVYLCNKDDSKCTGLTDTEVLG